MQILLILSFASYLFAIFKRPLIYLGVLLQFGYIISRASELERLPLVGPHDTIVFLAASMAAFAIPFSQKLKSNRGFHNLIVVSAALFTVLALNYEPRNIPLPPILKTFWFETHVVLAFMSYALFGVAAALGYVFLKDS